MRDPVRINEYLTVLREIWEENQDLRFSQLVLNVLRNPGDYYLEDDVTLQLFKDAYWNI